MYALLPRRTNWNERPCSVIVPVPPVPPSMCRSSVRWSAPLTRLPLTCTPCAAPAAATASFTTCGAVLAASPFDFEPPPQPASRAAVRTSGASSRVRIGAILSHRFPRVEARRIHHVGVAVADLDEAVSTYERLFGARLERRA